MKSQSFNSKLSDIQIERNPVGGRTRGAFSDSYNVEIHEFISENDPLFSLNLETKQQNEKVEGRHLLSDSEISSKKSAGIEVIPFVNNTNMKIGTSSEFLAKKPPIKIAKKDAKNCQNSVKGSKLPGGKINLSNLGNAGRPLGTIFLDSSGKNKKRKASITPPTLKLKLRKYSPLKKTTPLKQLHFDKCIRKRSKCLEIDDPPRTRLSYRMSQPKSKLKNQPKIDSYLLKGNSVKKTYVSEDSQDQETRLGNNMSQPSIDHRNTDMSKVKLENSMGNATKESIDYSLIKRTPDKFKKQLSVREILRKFENVNAETEPRNLKSSNREPNKKKLGLRTITPIKKRKMAHNIINVNVCKTPDKILSVKTMLKMYERNCDIQNKSTQSRKA